MSWDARVEIKHLFTKSEEYEDVQKSMNEVAAVLENSGLFARFHHLYKFHKIPADNEWMTPVEYANLLLSKMHDFADDNRILIG